MPGAAVEAKLWIWQRLSAAVLGICVIVHLAVIVYAVQGGLTADEIINRVSGNLAWFAFYAVFVIAVAVHAPIGIRAILNEMTPLRPGAVHAVMATFCLIILAMGFRAIIGLYNAGGV